MASMRSLSYSSLPINRYVKQATFPYRIDALVLYRSKNAAVRAPHSLKSVAAVDLLNRQGAG